MTGHGTALRQNWRAKAFRAASRARRSRLFLSGRTQGPPAGHLPRIVALAAAFLFLLTATSSTGSGTVPGGGAPVAAPGTQVRSEVPEGSADALTVVADGFAGDVKTRSENSETGGAEVEISYPAVKNAEPLTEHLETAIERTAEDFVLANPGAERITVEGDITAAGGDILGIRLTIEEVGVRMTSEETGGSRPGDDSEPRVRYETFWYDAAEGRVAGSTELLRDHGALVEVAALIREEVAADESLDADPDSILPVAGLFTSLGFNPYGDLVAEFGAGRIASASDGPITAVIEREQAAGLLSDLGSRALAAATVVRPGFELAGPPEGTPRVTASAAVPGDVSPTDEEVHCDSEETKCVALTFDDGPGSDTERLLDMLAEHDAKATFFITGAPAREHLPTVRRTYAEGHELANHTMTHPDLTGLSADGIRNETDPLQAIIRRETGHTPVLMRPPYGASDGAVREVMAEAGMAEILWSVDTEDWRDREAKVVAKRAIDGAKPGSVILFHDIHASTVDAMPRILEKLGEKGYTFVTVSQLLGPTEPGTPYRDAYPSEEDEEDEDDDEEAEEDEEEDD